jgi:two-component system response regulator MprA
LVVEDARAVRDALQRVLRTDGYQVDLAEDGEAGLSALTAREADAVVLDVVLPVVDGLEVCRRLRGAG